MREKDDDKCNKDQLVILNHTPSTGSQNFAVPQAKEAAV